MKKYYLLLFVIILSLNKSLSQNNTTGSTSIKESNAAETTLSGTITDAKTSKPLEGVTIYIPDLKLGVVTNAAGEYIIKRLPAGNYIVQVILVGYSTISQNVQLNGDVKTDFKLDESFIEGASVIVTGLSKATQIRRNPVPIVAINHDYITHNISTNAIDAISKVPGVRSVTTGPNVSKPFIRGLGYNRILSLYDGVRQEGQQWGDEHGIEVDQYSVDHIEVIKGPASLSYGSDALAGVVNIVPSQSAPEGKMIGDITTEYQTNNKYMGGSAMLGASKNGLEWMGRISHKQAVDYQDKIDGRVFGTAFNETDADASVGIHRSWGFSHLNFVLYDDIQEIPDGSRDSITRKFTRQISEEDTIREIVSSNDLNSYNIEHLHQHVQHYRLFLANKFVLGNGGSILLNIGYQRSVRREFSHPVLYDIPGLYLQLNSFTYDIKYSFPELKKWNITTGINGMYQQNTSINGTEFIIPNYHQFDIGGFLVAKRTIDKLDISSGLRYDIRSFKNEQLYIKSNPVTGFDMPVYGADTSGASMPFSDYNKTFYGFTGSIGATYNFSEKFSVKTNISRGFRAPNISEISANGVHPGTDIYQLGNPDFKPEFSLQEDIGADFVSKYVVASLSVFNNDISNYIYNQKVTNADGSDLIIVPGNQTFQFQASRAVLYGGEASIDIHPIKQLHFENSFSVVYGNNKGIKGKAVSDSAKYLPFIPPAHGLSELRFAFNVKAAHITNGFIKAQAEYYAPQNRAYLEFGTETPTPGYSLFNAGIGGDISSKKGKTMFTLYIMGNNLFNTAYQDHLSRLKYFEEYPTDPRGNLGIYNMGRNVSLKISVPINAKI